jgi:NADH dehydrogenase
VVMDRVTAIDVARREVRLERESMPIAYDYLILATGTRHAYFGHDDWEPFAPGLKSLDDAFEIRRRFLVAFERAERATDAAEREALMTFVIVGGGPTGVELAGMMVEIARKAMPRDFRNIDTRRTRVLLVEAGDRLLPAFPAHLSQRARSDLERLGVEVRTGIAVTRVTASAARVGDMDIPTRAVFWAAGNQASPLARDLGVPLDRAGRVLAEADLSVPGHKEIFVAGDVAVAKRPNGALVPGVAQGAIQGGAHAARNVLRLTRGEPTAAFRYFNKGDMATIGRNRAVADFGWSTLEGFPAWFLWVFIHVLYLVGFRNRASVLVQWAYAYFTFQRGVRLIIDREHAA